MATFRFAGRVLPTFKEFTLIGAVTANWNDPIDPPTSLIMSATLSITKGIVEILCDSNLFGTENFDGHVDLRANDLATSVVNCYAFAKGMGLKVVLDTVIKPDGILYNIHSHRPYLESLVTVLGLSRDGGIDIQGVLPIIMANPTIFVALDDLISAVTEAREVPLKCGRAIDAIRYSMAPAVERKQGWPVLRENLNISRQYLNLILDESKGPRHGDVMNTTFPAIREVITRSWIVMSRFLEFKKRGDQRLPLPDFPLLEP
jgi:hypothetical protein